MSKAASREDLRHAGARRWPEPPPGKSGWPWDVASVPLADERRPDGQPWPRFTVVVPSYSQGRFLEETIRSLAAQGYPDLELMVIDGGSSDDSVDVIRRYEDWISYWVSERDRGQTHAINKGLERASGEIFAYLNSDDVLMPGALFTVADNFARHPDVDVVHGRCIYIDVEGNELYSRIGNATSLPDYLRIWERFEKGDYLTQPEVFCRKRVLDQVGPFRESLHSVMDFEMWVRLLAAGSRFHRIDVPLAKFRTYPTQKSSVDPGGELCQVVEEYVTAESSGFSPETRGRLLEELRLARSHLLVRAAIGATMVNDYRTALGYCWAAVRGAPSIAGTYSFWAVILSPLKKVIPAGVVKRIRESLNPGTR